MNDLWGDEALPGTVHVEARLAILAVGRSEKLIDMVTKECG